MKALASILENKRMNITTLILILGILLARYLFIAAKKSKELDRLEQDKNVKVVYHFKGQPWWKKPFIFLKVIL